MIKILSQIKYKEQFIIVLALAIVFSSIIFGFSFSNLQKSGTTNISNQKVTIRTKTKYELKIKSSNQQPKKFNQENYFDFNSLVATDNSMQNQKVVLTTSNPISINGNGDFVNQSAVYNWQGDGTQGNPYIIKDLSITTGGISISNTNVYFKVQNCIMQGGGVYFYNVSNGQILDSNISGSPSEGFNFISTNFITITGNYLDSDTGVFYCEFCNNSIISYNNATNSGGISTNFANNNTFNDNQVLNANGANGFNLATSSNNNTLTNNIATFAIYGFIIDTSSNNSLIGNTALNSTDGFQISTANNTFIRNNLAINSSTGGGFDLTNSNMSVLESNYALNNADAFHIDGASINNIITNNTALYNIDSFTLTTDSGNNQLIGNHASNSYYGYNIMSTNNLLINNYDRNYYFYNNPIIYSPTASYYSTPTILLNYTSLTSGLQMYLDGVANNSLTNGTTLYNLAEGLHNFTVFIVVSSNTYIQRVLFTVDTVSPQLSIQSPIVTAYSTNSVQLTYTITEINPYTTSVILDGIANSTNMQSGSELTALSNGPHIITIVVIDAAGNTAMQSVHFNINVQNNSSSTTIASTTTTTTTTSTSTSEKSAISSNNSLTKSKTSPGFTIFSLIFVIVIIVPLMIRKYKKNQ